MSNDELFEMVRAAYERGYNWGQENPDSRPFLNKAAYDYADKTTSALALRTPSDGVKVKPLEWEDRWAETPSISSKSKRRIMERALTPFQAYFIEQSQDDDSWWLLSGLMGKEVGGPFEHDWQAREAAQIDFSDAIISALTGKE